MTTPDSNKNQGSLCIVTGLSGAGKSTALRAFEDQDYFAVDGLPAELLPDMARILRREEMRRYKGIAIGMDLRECNFPESFNAVLLAIASENIPMKLLFLEASDKELFRRYATTRRPHPLERESIGLASAIELERRQLMNIRNNADIVLDTTRFNIYDLRSAIRDHFSTSAIAAETLRVNLISFGFKYGIPKDSNYVFDLRFLPNPYFVETLKPFSGLDAQVDEFIFSHHAATDFINKIWELFDFVLPLLAAEGRKRVTIALGCTGGRHRSVAMVERLNQILKKAGYAVILEHRNLNHDLAASKVS